MNPVTYYIAENYTPAFTQENLDTLTAAIVSGATQVQYGDKMVTYRSLDDLFRLRRLMEADINAAGARIDFGRRTVGDYHSNK